VVDSFILSIYIIRSLSLSFIHSISHSLSLSLSLHHSLFIILSSSFFLSFSPTGDIIDIYPYEGITKNHLTGEVVANFKLKTGTEFTLHLCVVVGVIVVVVVAGVIVVVVVVLVIVVVVVIVVAVVSCRSR
jgi:hypothetical protein